MSSNEKVIKGLKECAGNGNCTKCQYGKEKQALSCKKLLADALELLTEQEAIESINFEDKTEIMANLEGLTWDDWRMYHSDTEVQNIAKSAFDLLIALVKEHEPIEPAPYMDGLVQRFACGNCGKHLLYARWGRDNYCSKCGQKVKWND